MEDVAKEFEAELKAEHGDEWVGSVDSTAAAHFQWFYPFDVIFLE